MNMNKKNRILFFVILFALFFNFNLLVNAADCSKYACATCVYSNNSFKFTYDLKSSGDGSADLNFSSTKADSNSRLVYKFSQNLVARNFITNENKLFCPNSLYIKYDAGASTTVGVNVSANKSDGYVSINLSSESTNNNLSVGNSTSKSCSYNSTSGAGNPIKITVSLVNNSLKYELTDGWQINTASTKITVDDFSGSDCPKLYVSCGSSGNNKYCSLSKTNDFNIRDIDPNNGTQESTVKETTEKVVSCPEGYELSGEKCVVVGHVAENPCDENSIRIVLRMFGYILLIARIAVPLIIIGFGTFDLFKSVIDKDEKSLTKQVKQLGIRILAGLIVFFIPNIVSLFFSLSDTLNIIETDQYKTCSNCLLKPTTCEVTED